MIWKFLGGSHGPLSRQSLIHVLRTRRERGQRRLWNESPRVHSSLVFTTTGVSPVTPHGHSLGTTLLILSVLSGAAGCAASPPMASPSLPELVEAKAGRTQPPPLAGNDGKILQPKIAASPAEALPTEALPMARICVRIKDGSSCTTRSGPRDPSWVSMLVPWPIQGRIWRIVPMLPRRKQKVAARWGGMRNAQERQNVEPCVYGRI